MAGSTSISSQATQYITSNITATSSNSSVVPTSATVQFAFIGPYNTSQQAADQAVTSSTTFYAASWASTNSYPTSYTCQCLVGPSSSNVTLSTGTYAVWIKLSGTAISPETPILFSGTLNVS